MTKVFAALLIFTVCFAPQVLAAQSDAVQSETVQSETVQSETASNSESETDAQKNLTQGSLNAYSLPSVTVYGIADQPPTVPVTTRFGTQFNVVTEEQISRQNAHDFYDALRNVPGVMFQKKNIIGGQTGASLYIRGRGANHPSPDLNIMFDDAPRSGVLYGQALADGIPVYALGGMEIYKYPQPSRFGSSYGMVNFIPRYMAEPGAEFKIGMEAGSYGTFAENVGAGVKNGPFDVYVAQSHIRTDGHIAHSAADQTSYYLNAGYQVMDNWSARLMLNYVNAATDAPDNPLTKSMSYPRRFDTETTLVAFTLANEYKKASGYIKGYYNNTYFSLVNDSAGGGVGNATSRQTNNLYGLRMRETFWAWEGGEVVTGFDLDKMDLENHQVRNDGGANTKWDFPNLTVFSPYLAVSHTFGGNDGFHVVPSGGLRYYYNSEFSDKAAYQAGLVFGYANTNLNFNYARGVNYPSPVVLQGFLTNSTMPSGFDANKIKPEVVDHYEVGLVHAWRGVGALSATFFYDNGKDRTRAYMFGAAPDESFFNSSTARYKIRGMELSGNLTPVETFELFAGAAWLWPKAVGDDGEKQKKMPYTPSFSFQAGFKQRFLEDFRFSGDYQHLRDVYAATSSRASNPASPSSTFSKLTNADRLPNVNVVNLRLDYMFKSEYMYVKEGNVFLALGNVLGAKYAYALATDGVNSANYYMPGRTFMAGFGLKFHTGVASPASMRAARL